MGSASMGADSIDFGVLLCLHDQSSLTPPIPSNLACDLVREAHFYGLILRQIKDIQGIRSRVCDNSKQKPFSLTPRNSGRSFF
jgi:hypothetical protein